MSIYFDLDTPALIVDRERLERNIANMAQLTGNHGKRLRPHTKTHKTPEIAKMQLDAGASGLTVAKVGEAEVLAAAGFDDIFIANQIVGSLKIERLLKLAEKVSVRVAVDSFEVAEPIGRAAFQRGIEIPLLIEADMGMGRAGTRGLEETVTLARQISRLKGVKLLGIMAYDGQVYRAGSEAEREQVAGKFAADLKRQKLALEAEGLVISEVSIGSTPGSKYLVGEETPTEFRPGTYVFSDRMQVRMGASPDGCALTVLATVTSVRSDGRIVIDAGTKSMASDLPFPDKTYGEIVGYPNIQFVGASEEHGHLQVEGTHDLKVGDRVRVVPNHVCTCVNMHEMMAICNGETVEAIWKIAARGRIQ